MTINKFAKELDDIITKRNLSNNKAANLSNMDPSLLRRYRKGERVPRNDKVLQQFKEGLALSAREENNLTYAYKLTKGSNNERKITLDDILSYLDKGSDEYLSTVWPMEEYICLCQNFDLLENQKMIKLNDRIQIQNALAYISKLSAEKENKVYILSKIFRKNDKLSAIKRFRIPNMENTEQLLITNQSMDEYDLFISYIHHSGIGNKDGKHSFYVYKTNATLDFCDSWLFFSDEFLLDYQIYSDSVSGYLTSDANVIQYHKSIYGRYQDQSKYFGENIKVTFLDLLGKVR